MANDEEYAIVSKKEFMALKAELDKLKKNPLEGSENGETLQASIDNLNKGLNNMLEVFKQASDDMKLEEHDSELLAKELKPLNDKLETLVDQNQKIAKGIVAVADMIKEKMDERPKLKPLSAPPPSGAPAGHSGMPPPGMPGALPSMPPPGAPPSMPPPGAPPSMPPPGGLDDNPFSAPPSMPPLGAPPSGDKGPSGKDIMGGLMK